MKEERDLLLLEEVLDNCVTRQSKRSATVATNSLERVKPFSALGGGGIFSWHWGI